MFYFSRNNTEGQPMIPSADINWEMSPVAYIRRNINTEEFIKT